MWIGFRNLSSLFEISKESVAALREDNAALRAENNRLASELASTKVNLDWLRINYNAVQLERTMLMQKAYGINLPVPELAVRNPAPPKPPVLETFDFEDIGDELADAIGLPRYDS